MVSSVEELDVTVRAFYEGRGEQVRIHARVEIYLATH